MTASAANSQDLYVWLSSEGAASADPAEGFWDDMPALEAKTEANPWMVGTFDFASDFPHWEMHPEGDEVFIAQSGDFVLTLERDGARSDHALKGGQTFIIPKGAWHFLKVIAPGRIVIITAGRGTQHRPV